MKLIRCDRCKIELKQRWYERGAEGAHTVLIKGHEGLSSLMGQRELGHLCSSCTRLLVDWMEGA